MAKKEFTAEECAFMFCKFFGLTELAGEMTEIEQRFRGAKFDKVRDYDKQEIKKSVESLREAVANLKRLSYLMDECK